MIAMATNFINLTTAKYYMNLKIGSFSIFIIDYCYSQNK